MSEIHDRLVRTARAAKRAEDVAEDQRAARDLVIAEAAEGGWSYAAIAEVVELSVSHVARVVIAQAARSQGDSTTSDR